MGVAAGSALSSTPLTLMQSISKASQVRLRLTRRLSRNARLIAHPQTSHLHTTRSKATRWRRDPAVPGAPEVMTRTFRPFMTSLTRIQATCHTSCPAARTSSRSSRSSWRPSTRSSRDHCAASLARFLSAAFMGITGVHGLSHSSHYIALHYTWLVAVLQEQFDVGQDAGTSANHGRALQHRALAEHSDCFGGIGGIPIYVSGLSRRSAVACLKSTRTMHGLEMAGIGTVNSL